MTIIPIILSGGAGTRLWPLSWGDHPKQFLSLITDKTMIQETLLRLDGLETGNPIISCGEGHRFLVAQQIGEITNKKPVILLEPRAKNTAPAIAAACCAAMKQDKDAVVVVLPSDHVIADVKAFQNAVKTAAVNAEKGYLVTFGIVPTFPSTGYGYVKAAGSETDGAYTLEKFVEKPCLEKAQEYLASGEYAWNSGMFVFKASLRFIVRKWLHLQLNLLKRLQSIQILFVLIKMLLEKLKETQLTMPLWKRPQKERL